MSTKIHLVQGDTKPVLAVSLTDQSTGAAFDVSDANTTVRLKFRERGAAALSDTIIASKVAGYVEPDGTINTDPPYNIPGAGGRVRFAWSSSSLTGESGAYEAEIEITFSDGTVQTVYDLIKFTVREQF